MNMENREITELLDRSPENEKSKSNQGNSDKDFIMIGAIQGNMGKIQDIKTQFYIF